MMGLTFALDLLIFLLWNQSVIHGESLLSNFVMLFGLEWPYPQLKYFYVMCCMCDDNDSCKHRHRSAQQMLGVLL